MDHLTIFVISLVAGLVLGAGGASAYWRYHLWKTNYLWSLQIHVIVRNALAALINGQVGSDGIVRVGTAIQEAPSEEDKDKSN